MNSHFFYQTIPLEQTPLFQNIAGGNFPQQEHVMLATQAAWNERHNLMDRYNSGERTLPLLRSLKAFGLKVLKCPTQCLPCPPGGLRLDGFWL